MEENGIQYEFEVFERKSIQLNQAELGRKKSEIELAWKQNGALFSAVLFSLPSVCNRAIASQQTWPQLPVLWTTMQNKKHEIS